MALWSVNDPAEPIRRSYVDSNLINGVEYWYSLVAFDTGASSAGLEALQNEYGNPERATNAVSAVPRTDPAGLVEAAGDVYHDFSGAGYPSEGNVIVGAFNRSIIQNADYEVVFEDIYNYDTYWHLINTTTGDTLLQYQTSVNLDPELCDIVEGLRIILRNAERIPRFIGQTALGGADTNLVLGAYYGPVLGYLTDDTSWVYSDAPFRNDYEFRYTGESTMAVSVFEPWYGPEPYIEIPLEVWNVTTGQRVSMAVWDWMGDGAWQPDDPITIVDYPYSETNDLTALAFPYYYGWMFEFDWTMFNPVAGDVFAVDGALMNGPGDVFSFHVSGDGTDIDAGQAAVDLDNIKVVPDPYYAMSSGLWETAQGESVLQFQNLPDECTIRIYTLTGDLVRVLENLDGSGTVEWDLLSDGDRLIASGIYIYHVESKYGDHLGRFAVVK